MIALLLMGCQQIPEFVQVSGAVFDDRHSASTVVAGATVRVMDASLEETDVVETGDDGTFSAQARAGQAVFFELSAEGFVPTAFGGTMGIEDAVVPDRVLWMATLDDLGELEGTFAGCPGVGEGGGLIEGEVRAHVPGAELGDGEEWPFAATAWAVAYDSDGVETDACYLDAETGLYDPEATLTGDTGRFAVFGGPTGPVTLAVGTLLDGAPYYETWFSVYVPDGGVAPIYPAYVPLPGF
ncbi:MAG: hypothetical protein H6739_23970 [Alphaproteobacteria bacterium]|nr:hypothetical protein [Alphaproteobacteria bacterium]